MFSIFSRKSKVIPFNHIVYTTDSHTHLLPYVDDGQFTMEQTLAQLEMMEAVGVREVCCTSHVIYGIHDNESSLLQERFSEVQAAYRGGIKLHLGAEYMVDELFMERISKKDLLPLPNNAVLMDMSYVGEAEWINHAIFEIRLLGYTPTLAHPERYLYLADKLEVFDQYANAGAQFQLNLLSLSGVYGKHSMKILDYMFSKGFYKLIGTDLHSGTQWEKIRSIQVPYKYAKAGEQLGLWQLQENTL